MQTKILEFLDTFYHTTFTKEKFESFKAGVVGRKKSGFLGLEDEAEDLYVRMRHFAIEASDSVEWDRTDKEIECIEKYCTYEKCKSFFYKLFAPEEKLKKRKSTIKEFELFKEIRGGTGYLNKHIKR